MLICYAVLDAHVLSTVSPFPQLLPISARTHPNLFVPDSTSHERSTDNSDFCKICICFRISIFMLSFVVSKTVTYSCTYICTLSFPIPLC